MIINLAAVPLPSWAPAVACALVLGCGHRSPSSETYQGVVEHEERLLAFEVGGRVTRVAVRRGDHVDPEAVVAEIDDRLERLARAARVEEAEAARAEVALLEAGAKGEDLGALAAQLRGARAARDLAAKSKDRVQALYEAGAVARAELDRADAEVARADAESKAAEQRLASLQRGARSEEIARATSRADAAHAAVALADERLARHVLRARDAGEIVDVHVDPGELAAAGAPVATVADTTRPYVEVFVPEQDLAGVRAGTKATVTLDATPHDAFAGTVEHVATRTEFTPRFVFSERERKNLVVRVRIRIDDPQRRAHAGVPAFVSIAR